MARVGSASNAVTSAATRTIVVPASAVAGQLMYLLCECDTGGAFSADHGAWNTIFNGSINGSSANGGAALLWKEVAAGDIGATITVTNPANNWSQNLIVLEDTNRPTTPHSGSPTEHPGSATSGVGTALTTVDNSTMDLILTIHTDNGPGNHTSTFGSEWIDIASFAIYDATQATAGPFASQTITFNGVSLPYEMFQLAIAPPAAIPPDYAKGGLIPAGFFDPDLVSGEWF